VSNKLESLIAKAGSRLSAKGLARWWKIPNDLRLLPGGRITHGAWTPCDFMGFTSDGRSILIEAKMAGRNRLAVGGEKTSGVKGHQWTALQLAERCHCLALLVWMRHEEVAVMTMHDAKLAMGHHRSIPWFELETIYEANSPPDSWFAPYL